MTQKECDRARGAYHLETTSGDISGHRKKETEQRRGTHILEVASRGKSQDTERNRLSEGHLLAGDPNGGISQDTERERPSNEHSHSGDHIGRDKSGHEKKSAEQRVLTSWRPHWEGQVRTRKESGRATTGTHILETASGGTSQDMERN
jgi:hypothetical protein